jgi:hypothetical protein
MYCHWHARRIFRLTRQGVSTVTIKTSIVAAVAAVLVSSITVGAAIAPAQAQAQSVTFPVRTLVNA